MRREEGFDHDATPANKDIYRQSGLSTEELEGASANDMVVVADVDDEGILDVIMQEVEEFFKKQSTSESEKKGAESVKSWDKRLKNCRMRILQSSLSRARMRR